MTAAPAPMARPACPNCGVLLYRDARPDEVFKCPACGNEYRPHEITTAPPTAGHPDADSGPYRLSSQAGLATFRTTGRID